MACLFPPRMSVRMCKPEMVTPKTPTPREKKPLSDVDDQASLRYQLPMLWFYKSKTAAAASKLGRNVDDPASLIREGLAKALVFYYPLAGRLLEGPKKKLIVDCTGEGVLFVRAEANLSLEELGGFVQAPCPYLKKLVYRVPGADGITGAPLLLFQVTRFTCGGFALGLMFNHTIMDGYGVVLFLTAVCELATGGALAPSVLPVWERELLTAAGGPESSPSGAMRSEEHAMYSTSSAAAVPSSNNNKKRRHFKLLDLERWASMVMNFEKMAANPRYFFFSNKLKPFFLRRSFTLGPREILALKAHASAAGEQIPGRYCTTFEVVVACLWKCRTIGLQPDPDATVRVTFTADIRGRSSATGLTLPRGYYGNGIMFLSAATTAKLLCESPFSYAVDLIREAKRSLHANYVTSVLDFLVVNGRPRVSTDRNLSVSDISSIGLEKVDFGWGNATYAGVATSVLGFSFLERAMSAAAGVGAGAEKSMVVPITLPDISLRIFKREWKRLTRSLVPAC